MSWVSSFLGTGKQTTTTGLDPRTQAYVDAQRKQGQTASGVALNNPGDFFLGADPRSIQDQIAPFMNAYNQNVVDATRGEFDHLRGQATAGANSDATLSGAFGGSRAAVMQGTRLGALDRAQASAIADLQKTSYDNALSTGLNYSEYVRGLNERRAQEPIWRQQQALNFTTGAMGPYGTTTTKPGASPFGLIAGGLQVASGLGFNPFKQGGGTPSFQPPGMPGVTPGLAGGGPTFKPGFQPFGGGPQY
jgi:hypothetical protein